MKETAQCITDMAPSILQEATVRMQQERAKGRVMSENTAGSLTNKNTTASWAMTAHSLAALLMP